MVYSKNQLVQKWPYYSNFSDFFSSTIPSNQGVVPLGHTLKSRYGALKSGYGYGSFVTHSLRWLRKEIMKLYLQDLYLYLSWFWSIFQPIISVGMKYRLEIVWAVGLVEIWIESWPHGTRIECTIAQNPGMISKTKLLLFCISTIPLPRFDCLIKQKVRPPRASRSNHIRCDPSIKTPNPLGFDNCCHCASDACVFCSSLAAIIHCKSERKMN